MSIIAEALKKAQEKRERSFEKTSRTLEKIISTDTGLIPEKYRKNKGKSARFTFTGARKVLFTGTRKKELLLISFLCLLAIFTVIMSMHIVEKPGIQSVESSYSRESSQKPRFSQAISSPRTADLKPKTITGSSGLNLPVLSGIMYSSSKPQAILNGILVSEGDHSGDYRIVSILPEKIIVSLGEKESEISLR